MSLLIYDSMKGPSIYTQSWISLWPSIFARLPPSVYTSWVDSRVAELTKLSPLSY